MPQIEKKIVTYEKVEATPEEIVELFKEIRYFSAHKHTSLGAEVVCYLSEPFPSNMLYSVLRIDAPDKEPEDLRQFVIDNMPENYVLSFRHFSTVV